MRLAVLDNGNVVRVDGRLTEVVLNSGQVVRGYPQENDEQLDTARSLGYGLGQEAADAMVRDHDPLHAALASWLGVESFALRVEAGEEGIQHLADLEEDAVLAVQRLMVAAGLRVPGKWREK